MKPYLIGISGGSGSGKTLFINKIIEYFNEKEVCFISQDNYYRPIQDQPIDENGIVNFDKPESIDIQKFINDIHQLRNGKELKIKEYTFNNPKLNPKTIYIQPAPVIILEGIFIFFLEEISKLIDLRVFIEAREHIMLKRRIIRDKEERGYDLEDVLYQYENHVMPSFDQYILPYRDTCDLIINNHSDFKEGLKIVRSYIVTLLNRQKGSH
jgi:uridine kinase